MKYFLSLFTILVLICSGFQTGYASQLIYKYSRDIKSETLVEFTNLDVTAYQQIRIVVKRKPERNDTEDTSAFEMAVYTFDADDEIFIASAQANVSYTTLLESPPSKLRIKIKGNGTFSFYVFATA